MLLHSNHAYKEKGIEPALVFIKPDDKGRCPTIALPIVPADLEKVTSEIGQLLHSVFSGDFMSDMCDDKNCEYCSNKKFL